MSVYAVIFFLKMTNHKQINSHPLKVNHYDFNSEHRFQYNFNSKVKKNQAKLTTIISNKIFFSVKNPHILLEEIVFIRIVLDVVKL